MLQYVYTSTHIDGELEEEKMQRKLTITVDDEVYQALHQQIGRGNISGFIENLVRPHIWTEADLEEGYRAMAADTEREREAEEWIEALIGETLE